MFVRPEDTRDSAFIVRVVRESSPSNVRAPLTVSRSGAISLVSPDAPSAVIAPLICSTLLIVIMPVTEEEMMMLPSRVSQSYRLSASLWLEMVTLREPVQVGSSANNFCAIQMKK